MQRKNPKRGGFFQKHKTQTIHQQCDVVFQMATSVRSKREVKQTKLFGFEESITKVVEQDEVTDEEDLLDSQSPERPIAPKLSRKVSKSTASIQNGDIFGVLTAFLSLSFCSFFSSTDQVHRSKTVGPVVDRWISEYKVFYLPSFNDML